MNQSDCGELCISFDPYSFFEINNFFFNLLYFDIHTHTYIRIYRLAMILRIKGRNW